MVAKNVIEVSAVPAVKTVLAGFHALSDPLRLQVINLLREKELCVCELCEQLAVNQSKLSFHLKILKEAGLLGSRQEGRWIYYRLNPSQFGVLEAYLAEHYHASPISTSHSDCD
ncbi:Transcriptional regulator, ArsR family [Planktothrix sp. PCC 11201]|uniref:ArsR/SmtB family transcription factor n=1 Tax=Planktothrix sp. PCC 11201 TaxID=1729650 RepID=UPI000911D63A|nr:metalloregulator ArsR/SmtB family transcription factor [Planktothrix sp. PCC 11201]SKB11813.1 Transcriptional regulator, ArsR family [Planktothrix sp. PCC 11201]